MKSILKMPPERRLHGASPVTLHKINWVTCFVVSALVIICNNALPGSGTNSRDGFKRKANNQRSITTSRKSHPQMTVGSISSEWKTSNVITHIERLYGIRYAAAKNNKVGEVRQYMYDYFKSLGVEVYEQSFEYQGAHGKNIVARIPGQKNESVTYSLCAHYDTVEGSSGADDNASGIAVMMESARILSRLRFDHSILFIGFDLEEKGSVGSAAFFTDKRHKSLVLKGAINLDMVGYYSDKERSQLFPEELRAEYKKEFELVRDNKFRGDFILNFSNDASDSLRIVYNSIASVIAPDLKVVSFVVAMDGKKTPHFFRASDHVSFWNNGVSSISIGDTGGLRNPNYHAPTDAISTLDLNFMEKVGKVTTATVSHLSKAINGSVDFGKSKKGQKR